MTFELQGIERKELAILKILSDSQEALGARVIAHYLKDLGFELGEIIGGDGNAFVLGVGCERDAEIGGAARIIGVVGPAAFHLQDVG